jgi:tyrosine-protein kinase Etk/Wzc
MTAFFRQRRKFAIVFLLIMAGGVNYIAFTKSQYEAAGSLLVKFGRDATPEIARTEGNEPSIITQGDRRETIESDMQILQSHGLLYEIVHGLGAENLYPGITGRVKGTDDPDEAVIRDLWKGDLIVKSNPQSNVIDIRLLNQNPQLAAQFVHTLFQRFIARQSEVFNKPQTNLLEIEVKEAAAKLEASQTALETFKAQNGISSIDDELDELLRQKTDAGTLALDEDNDAWARLAEMQAKEKEMLATYLPDSPLVIRQHESVVLAQKQLRQRQAAQHERITASTTQINKRIAELEMQRSHYNDLQRQVEIGEQNYKNYNLRSENARINELLNRNRITPIVVVDEPVVPIKPAYPRRKLIMGMCLLAGLIFGAGTALVFETLDPRFTAPAQISEVLGVPVMANFS